MKQILKRTYLPFDPQMSRWPRMLHAWPLLEYTARATLQHRHASDTTAAWLPPPLRRRDAAAAYPRPLRLNIS
jgi:hypothetical protein